MAQPPDFTRTTVLSGLSQPISLAFLPDGRMLVLQRGGTMLIAEAPDYDTASVYMTITNTSASQLDEWGLVDITLDPDFSSNGYFYLYYSTATPQLFRISRFTHIENSGGLTSQGDTASEFVLWTDDETYITTLYHYGGGLDFGPDGKIYCATGDKFIGFRDPMNGWRAQIPESYAGKILRINKDGSIPDGSDGYPANPWVNVPGKDEIWGLGLRNPFRARWDIPSGRFFIAEVGSNDEHPPAWEDLHICKATSEYAGINYGWPLCEGLPPYRDTFCFIEKTLAMPLYTYSHPAGGGCIIGGVVYRGSAFPSYFNGSYFFADFTHQTLKYLTFHWNGDLQGVHLFADSIAGVVAIEEGTDGNLYVIQHFDGAITRFSHEPSGLDSSWVVIAETKAEMQRNTIFSGGVGVTGGSGKLLLANQTMLTATGTFAQAAYIAVKGGSMVSQQISTPLTIQIPAFEFNPSCQRGQLSIPANTIITLNGNNFGSIIIGKNSTVTFTESQVTITNLFVKDSSRVNFSGCANVRICNKLSLGERCIFNADENNVSVYVMRLIEVGSGSAVNGRFQVQSGSLVLKDADALSATIMKGRFISRMMYSGKYVQWYYKSWDDPCNMSTSAAAKTDGKEVNDEFPFEASPVKLKVYPNPFEDILNIEFSLQNDSKAIAEIFSIAGQRLAVIFDGTVKSKETQTFQFENDSQAGGIIVVRLQTSVGAFYQKAVLVK